MKITPHFTLSEFAQPKRHGLPYVPYPQAWVQSRLRPLCEALELLRSNLGGKSIVILSGYRTAPYNAKIGGARRSQHMAGTAADIVVTGCSPQQVYDMARELVEYTEIGGLGLYPGFVHVDVRRGPLVRWTGSRS